MQVHASGIGLGMLCILSSFLQFVASFLLQRETNPRTAVVCCLLCAVAACHVGDGILLMCAIVVCVCVVLSLLVCFGICLGW